MLSNLAMWSLIVGFFAPPVQAAIAQWHFGERAAALASLAFSALAGAGTAYFEGDLNGKTFVQAALIVMVATITSYKGLWKPTGIAPAIENATTPGGPDSLPR